MARSDGASVVVLDEFGSGTRIIESVEFVQSDAGIRVFDITDGGQPLKVCGHVARRDEIAAKQSTNFKTEREDSQGAVYSDTKGSHQECQTISSNGSEDHEEHK